MAKIIDINSYREKKTQVSKEEELKQLMQRVDTMRAAHQLRRKRYEDALSKMLCPHCGSPLVLVTRETTKHVCTECSRVF